ncbi:hypothetical protein LWI28_028490 [Acer negundo]|uniref:CAAX prenyl protease 2/Lysostaphin resistance protein A-like domain-containing protein n=1 Tax=Acer negundo TaxID=4023 RepID=A0AAD5IP28_ACENE|nr:hypothetical protein LWI28_028490 [Acer negundo]KAK4841213.1 hypothetical protein QYF36_000850 [Acer negundo]
MGSLTMNNASTTYQLCPISTFMSGKFFSLYNGGIDKSHNNTLRFGIKAFASRKSVKKLKRDRKLGLVEESNVEDKSAAEDDSVIDGNSVSSVDDFASKKLTNFPQRSSVLQACTVTCGFIAALGVIIRQVSHTASVEGFPVIDCSTEVSFGFEIWHLELITGLVILISSCRYLLLKIWPDFAESSEAANQQVLTSLEPLDYLVVAFLPGFSEELLFRGALLPLFGIDWKSVLFVASIFGALHLGSGRKYSFAVWATFVGFIYGYATIVSNTIVVPMASHALNNLVKACVDHCRSNQFCCNCNKEKVPPVCEQCCEEE